MAADLSGVEAKIGWAKCHLAALKKAIGDTLETHPYRFVGQMDAETGEYVISVHDLPAMDPTWSLRVGDVVHNLRSALDHLAWQLVILDGRGSPNRDTVFPIRKSPVQNGCRTPTQLKPAVSKSAILNALEAVQPYLDREGKPANYANNLLWRLHRLDIIDKHRLLLVVRAALKVSGMSWGWYGEDPPRVRLNGAPLDDGDAVAWFDVRGRQPPPGWSPNPDISIVLYEEEVRDLTDRSVVEVLEVIAGWVEDYIVHYTFRPLFRDSTDGRSGLDAQQGVRPSTTAE